MRLPLRTWLVAALLLIVLTPVAVAVAVNGAGQGSRLPDSRQAEIEALLASAPTWSDAAWRRRADRWFADRRVHLFVLDERQRVVYTSPGASARSRETGSLLRVTDRAGEQGFVFVMVSPEQPTLLVLAPGLLGLVAALALVAWLVSRTVLRPLARVGDAARRRARPAAEPLLHRAPAAGQRRRPGPGDRPPDRAGPRRRPERPQPPRRRRRVHGDDQRPSLVTEDQGSASASSPPPVPPPSACQSAESRSGSWNS